MPAAPSPSRVAELPLRWEARPTRQPLLYAGFAFAAGILLGHFCWRPAPWWLATVIIFLLAAFVFRGRKLLTLACALAALAGLGALTEELHRVAAPRPPDLSAYAQNDDVHLLVHVLEVEPVRRLGGHTLRQVLLVESESIGANSESLVPLRARIRLSVYSDGKDGSDAQPFSYGQRLRLAARLRLPRNFGNPGAFDYRGYLLRQGIVATAWTQPEKVEVLPGLVGSTAARWRSQLRDSLTRHIQSLWPAQQAMLVSAMLLGERAVVERDLRLDFQRSGAYHILVVSGMHVGILAFVLFWLARRVRIGESTASLLTIVLTSGYAYLVGGAPPVVRATIMLALYLLTRLLYRGRAPLNAIGAAGLGVLLFDPDALFEPSFQLTFLAVLAIVGVALPLVERTSAPYRAALRHLDSVDYDISLPPRLAQFRLDLRLLLGRLQPLSGKQPARWLVMGGLRVGLSVWELLLVSAVMQVALALPMAWYFHRASLVGLAANTLIVPLASIVLPAGGAAVMLSYVSQAAAWLPAQVSAAALSAMSAVVQAVGGWRAAELRVATPSAQVAWFAAVAFLLAMMAVRRRRSVALVGLASLLAAALVLVLLRPQPDFRKGVLEVTAMDVGQGDSILVVTPDGRTLLIDAGGALGGDSEFDFGEDVVSPCLWQRGITRLDVVALSHAHADHIGGMGSVIANFRPREIWVGKNPPTPAYQDLLAIAGEEGARIVQRVAGEEFPFGGTGVKVLAPAADWEVSSRPRNDDSLVLRLALGKTSVLLPGDIERRIERRVAPELEHADLLKVPHHGSATSTTPQLLEQLQPEFAVISVGSRSRFGHPRPEVLERLASAQVATYRSDTMGAVTFYLDGERVTPSLPSRR